MAIGEGLHGLISYEFLRRYLAEKTFLRCDTIKGKEFLREVPKSELSLWERIRMFFGCPPDSFKLENIQRVAQAILVPIGSMSLSAKEKKYAHRAIKRLNASIEKHNSRRPFLWGHISEIEKLDVPEAFEGAEALEKAEKPEPRVSSEEPSPLASIRGIQNPGCLCYFISSLVALCASPKVMEALQSEKGEAAGLLRKVFEEMTNGRADSLSFYKGALGNLYEYLKRKRAFPS